MLVNPDAHHDAHNRHYQRHESDGQPPYSYPERALPHLAADVRQFLLVLGMALFLDSLEFGDERVHVVFQSGKRRTLKNRRDPSQFPPDSVFVLLVLALCELRKLGPVTHASAPWAAGLLDAATELKQCYLVATLTTKFRVIRSEPSLLRASSMLVSCCTSATVLGVAEPAGLLGDPGSAGMIT